MAIKRNYLNKNNPFAFPKRIGLSGNKSPFNKLLTTLFYEIFPAAASKSKPLYAKFTNNHLSKIGKSSFPDVVLGTGYLS